MQRLSKPCTTAPNSSADAPTTPPRLKTPTRSPRSPTPPPSPLLRGPHSRLARRRRTRRANRTRCGSKASCRRPMRSWTNISSAVEPCWAIWVSSGRCSRALSGSCTASPTRWASAATRSAWWSGGPSRTNGSSGPASCFSLPFVGSSYIFCGEKGQSESLWRECVGQSKGNLECYDMSGKKGFGRKRRHEDDPRKFFFCFNISISQSDGVSGVISFFFFFFFYSILHRIQTIPQIFNSRPSSKKPPSLKLE